MYIYILIHRRPRSQYPAAAIDDFFLLIYIVFLYI